MASRNVYWDSCTWLRYINGEPGADDCAYIIECAKRNEVKIWTSSLTLAEVFKVKCSESHKELTEARDKDFEDYLLQGFVQEVQVDHEIAVRSRRLCRAHGKLKKPADGIHVASAALWNLDEFHTYDEENLLPLDGLVQREDGVPLKICKPPSRPPMSRGNIEMFKEPDA